MTALAKIPSTVSKMLAKLGTNITYTFVTSGAYDPATATIANNEITQKLKAIVEDYTIALLNRGNMGEGQAAGTLIQEGDKKITISGYGLSGIPNTGDKITVGSTTYNVISITTVYASDSVALYACQSRRA